MPVRNCCTGCMGPLGYGGRTEGYCTVGPICAHGQSVNCCRPHYGNGSGGLHGYRGGVAGSFFSCGHGCIGGCNGGLCGTCCGPSCN